VVIVLGPCFSARAATVPDELGKSWAVAQAHRFIGASIANRRAAGGGSFAIRGQTPAVFRPSRRGD
jgi:hypothetical protein